MQEEKDESNTVLSASDQRINECKAAFNKLISEIESFFSRKAYNADRDKSQLKHYETELERLQLEWMAASLNPSSAINVEPIDVFDGSRIEILSEAQKSVVREINTSIAVVKKKIEYFKNRTYPHAEEASAISSIDNNDAAVHTESHSEIIGSRAQQFPNVAIVGSVNEATQPLKSLGDEFIDIGAQQVTVDNQIFLYVPPATNTTDQSPINSDEFREQKSDTEIFKDENSSYADSSRHQTFPVVVTGNHGESSLTSPLIFEHDSGSIQQGRSRDDAPLSLFDEACIDAFNNGTFSKSRHIFAFAPWRQNLLRREWFWKSHIFSVDSNTRWGRVRNRLQRFWQRTKGIDQLWQPTLAAALIYDIQQYWAEPHERYGNNPHDLSLWLAKNPAAISTHWGSDMVTDGNYWISPVLLSALTLTYGFGVIDYLSDLRCSSKKSRHDSSITDRGYKDLLFTHQPVNDAQEEKMASVIDDGAEDAQSLNRKATVADDNNWPPPYTSDTELRQEANKVLSLSPILFCTAFHDKHPAYNILIRLLKTIKYGYRFSLRANTIKQLVKFADKQITNEQQLRVNPEENWTLSSIAGGVLLSIASGSKNYMPSDDKDAMFNSLWEKLNLLHPVHARYLLWAMGFNHKTSDEATMRYRLKGGSLSAAFGLYLLWSYYANIYKYWMLLFDKFLVRPSIYLMALSACSAENKQFLYSAQRDEYICGICNDWDFVPIKDANDAQKCLTALLQQDFPPEELAQYLAKFRHHPNFSSVGLTKQRWPDWNDFEWDRFLTELERIVSLQSVAAPEQQGLELFDLSSPVLRLPPFQLDNKITRLTAALQRIRPRIFSMSNLAYGHDKLFNLYPGFINNRTQVLDLSATALIDEGMQELAIFLPNTRVTHLIASRNDFTDAALLALIDMLEQHHNMSLQQIDLSGNHFSDIGLTQFASTLLKRPIDSLRFDNIGLSREATGQLFRAMAQGNSSRISVQNCQLDDVAFLDLNDALCGIRELDLSHNVLTDNFLAVLASCLPDSKLEVLRLAQTRVSRDGLELLGPFIPESNLTVIDITGCRIQGAVPVFFTGVLASRVQQLLLGDTRIDNAGLQSFTNALNISVPLNLHRVDLSRNGLSSDIIIPFIDAIANSSVGILSLAGNPLLGNPVVQRIAGHLSDWPLRSLDISQTTIDSLVPFAETIQDSKLRELIADNNAIQSAEGLPFIRRTMTAIKNFDQLRQLKLSRGLKRELHQQQARTPLRNLSVRNNLFDTPGALMWCRVSDPTNLQINLAGNPINPTLVNELTCQVSAAAPRYGAFPMLLISMLLSSVADQLLEIIQENPTTALSLVTLLGVWAALWMDNADTEDPGEDKSHDETPRVDARSQPTNAAADTQCTQDITEQSSMIVQQNRPHMQRFSSSRR